jgi:nucleoside-diphosphate-sugar epimerase
MQSYILSKRQFETWARLISENTIATKIVNARLEHVYGPGDGSKKFVPDVLAKLLAGERLALTPGDQLRDFVHVDDVVKAYLAILQGMDALPAGFTEAQVGTGEAVTVRDFVETARTLCHSSSVIEFGTHPHRGREIMRSQADTRVLRELGWQARHGLSTGIGAVLNAMATENIQFSHSILATDSRS